MGSSIVLRLYKVIWGSRILIDHFMELDEEYATMVSIFQCIYFCVKILAEAFRRYKPTATTDIDVQPTYLPTLI